MVMVLRWLFYDDDNDDDGGDYSNWRLVLCSFSVLLAMFTKLFSKQDIAVSGHKKLNEKGKRKREECKEKETKKMMVLVIIPIEGWYYAAYQSY